jgi:hypothetical protein
VLAAFGVAKPPQRQQSMDAGRRVRTKGEIMESWMVDLLVQAVSGAVGGTAAGSILKDLSLGKPGDAISGAIGGGLVGQILNSVLGGGGDVAGMDVGAVVKDIVGGGVGGAVVMAIIGMLRNAMMKR